MRRFAILVGALIATVLVSATLVAQQSDPWLGTWKLNVAKSIYKPGPGPKSNTLKIEAVPGGAQRHTFDGVDAEGKPLHTDRVGTFDETEVPVQGVPDNVKATNKFKRLDARSFEVSATRNGKPSGTTRVVVAPDGKTMTQTATGTDAKGQAFNNTTIWEKQ